MRNLEQLLINAFPEELERTPPAPVRRRAVRERAFEKLGLSRDAAPAQPAGPWSQALPVVKRRRPWLAAAAAVLALALTVGMGRALYPLLAGGGLPTPAGAASLELGTYLELEVAEASFDQEAWALVLDLEARTDMDLSSPGAAALDWWYALSIPTEKSHTFFEGGEEALSQLGTWEKAGDGAYRCRLSVEILPESQRENGIFGQLEATLSLRVNGPAGAPESGSPGLEAQASFPIQLPAPQEASSQESQPNQGSYFECQTVEASYDPARWSIVLDLEARTHMDLDNPECQSLYGFMYTLIFHGPGGDFTYPSYDGVTLETLSQWSETGEGTYRCQGFSIPIDPAVQQENNLTGPLEATLRLVVTDASHAGSRPLTSEAGFSVELPDPDSSLQDGIMDMMLNSMDNFSTAQVSFTTYDQISGETAYTIETNLDTGISHQVTSHDGDGSVMETYSDGADVYEYDSQTRTVRWVGDVEERRTRAQEWSGTSERYFVDENGDPHYRYRGNPTNATMAGECLLPQAYAFGYLLESSLWQVDGTVEFCGRTCYDITGTVRDDYNPSADLFQMYVDRETGILLMLDAWNSQGTVNSVEVSEIVLDNPEVCRTFTYDMTPYEDYTWMGNGTAAGPM